MLETKKRKPTYEVAYALAQALDIDPETALTSAFQARREFDLEKEKRSLEQFVVNENLKGLRIADITRS